MFDWADRIEAATAELSALDTVEMGRSIADMVEYDMPEVRCGPLVDRDARDCVVAMMEQAEKKGAKKIFGEPGP